MNMVGSDIESVEVPPSVRGVLSDGGINGLSGIITEHHWWVTE